MTDAELSAIEARAEAATKGPWRAEELRRGFAIQHLSRGEFRIDDQWYSLPSVEVFNKAPVFGRPVAEFIAHAREDIPALISEVRRLRDALREIAAGRLDHEHGFDDFHDRVRALAKEALRGGK